MKLFRLVNVLLFASIVLFCSFVGCNKTPQTKAESDSAEEIKYDDSQEIFTNPERGFMHLYSVASEGEPLKLSALQNLKKENVTLVHRNYYFEKFKDKPLSEAELTLIKTDFQNVREAGVKMILCFAYTGIEYVYYTNQTDAPLSTIEMHLDQLKPLFEANKDVIAFVQAGFVGPWGEWHNSTNGLNTPENMKKVLDKMLSVVPADIMLQVRTPIIKQTIFGTKTPVDSSIAYTSESRARVGHYNDCFMTGATDYGTYTDIPAEKAYIASEALYVPAGGETCPPEDGGDGPSCAKAIAEMSMLRWTYLNLDWYKPTINSWKTSGCFDEFQRNLGYRLALVSARLPKEIAADNDLNVQVTLKNNGYAPVYNNKNTSLVLKDHTSGEVHQFPLSADIRKCKPAGALTIDEPVKLKDVPAGTYDLYLKIADRAQNLSNRPEYCIRLANPNVKLSDSGLNNLSHQLIVTK